MLWFIVLNYFELLSQILVVHCVQNSTQDDQDGAAFTGDDAFVDDIEQVLLYGLEIIGSEEPFFLERLELIKFIYHPSQRKNESLNFTN